MSEFKPGDQEPLPPVQFNLPKIVESSDRTESLPPIDRRTIASTRPFFVFGGALNSPTADSDTDPDVFRHRFQVGEGRRIVIDRIPYRDKATGDLIADRNVQVYRNRFGYLVADKVVDGEIAKPGTQIEQNNEKKEYESGEVQLLSTTYDFPLSEGKYQSVEITLTTEDDTGDSFEIELISSNLEGFHGEIPIKSVPDIR